MLDIWKDAKKNKKILHFKNFHQSAITWQEALDFVYTESKDGRIIQQHEGYFFLQDANLFMFDQVKEFMDKVNGGPGSEECKWYKSPEQKGRQCSQCGKYWHIQTLRFSITDHKVSNHNDPNDVLYWQLLGTSKWIMNQNTEYLLNPGDLLYFNQEDSHEVLQDGPRAGIIIDGRKKEAQ